jgi:hypothetical protein
VRNNEEFWQEIGVFRQDRAERIGRGERQRDNGIEGFTEFTRGAQGLDGLGDLGSDLE